MRVLSLFDGISCGMLALQRANIPVEAYEAFEIDKYAVTVSEKNYPEINHHGNVFDGDFTKFKGYDLLLGGSPCTYWSIAKQGRETSCDGEGFRLFSEYVRALHESECRYFLYENNFSIHQNIKDEITKALGCSSRLSSIPLWCQVSTENAVIGRISRTSHSQPIRVLCFRTYLKTVCLGRIKATA